jgi:hypothetical protein
VAWLVRMAARLAKFYQKEAGEGRVAWLVRMATRLLGFYKICRKKPPEFVAQGVFRV